MPFELTNAAQTSQQFIGQVVGGLTEVYAHIDDIPVASATVANLRQLFLKLQEHGITIKVE